MTIFFYLYNVSNCRAYQYTQSNKMLSIHRGVMACRDDDSFVFALSRTDLPFVQPASFTEIQANDAEL